MEESTLDYISQGMGGRHAKSKLKKKHMLHSLAGPETGCEADVDEAETQKRKEKPFDVQENKMHKKKKKKKFLIEGEDAENQREDVEGLQTNSDEDRESKKQRKEKLGNRENPSENNWEGVVQGAKTPTKKRKGKDGVNQREDREGSQINSEDDMWDSKKLKKMKKMKLEAEERSRESAATVGDIENNREGDVQGAKTSKKKGKKKIAEAEDDGRALEPVTPSDHTGIEYTHEDKARRRKKKGRIQDEDSSILEPVTSCIGDTTISDHADSDVPVSVKKKKKKLIAATPQAVETESDCEPQIRNSPRKGKKKGRHSQNGHDETIIEEQPEASCAVPELDNSQDSASETNQEPPESDSSVNLGEATETQPTNGADDSTVGSEEKDVLSTQVSKRKRNTIAQMNLRKRDLDILEEYFPNLYSLCSSTVLTLVTCELERVKDAKQRGIAFNRGRFTDEENEKLKQNVKSFMELSGIQNEEMLFHSYRYPEEKKMIEDIKKKFHFRVRISEGIPRSMQEICHRGIKMFDFSGNKGRFTDEEIKQLKKNWKIHGNNWIAVGASIGRNNVKVQLKASQLRRETNKGPWNEEETNKLINAVKEYVLSLEGHTTSNLMSDIIIKKQKLYKGIPWVQIEEKVETRNWTQCKTKWIEILFLRMNNGVSLFDGPSGLEAQIKIIQWLYDHGPKESGQVNWEELAEHIGNVPPMILQIKFYNLKSSHVSNWQRLSFREIVYHLYTNVLPLLAEKLKGMQDKNKNLERFEKRDEYTASEIFFEYTEDRKAKASKSSMKRSSGTSSKTFS